MDFLFTHTNQYERLFTCALPVHSIGYVSTKRTWVDQAFDSLNFSFILRGGGEYRTADRVYQVEAPCVIIQWPGVKVNYGPAFAHDSWEELFLIYAAESAGQWQETGLVSPATPTWRIRKSERIRELINELMGFKNTASTPGLADRIDQLCQTLILESRLGEKRVGKTPENQVIDAICQYIDAHLETSLNFEDISRRHHVSYSTFRRYWHRSMSESPTRYLTRRRIQEAKRLLAETHLPIGDIAQAVGYADPMYFSRKFHQEAQVTARCYRRLHQVPLDRLI